MEKPNRVDQKRAAVLGLLERLAGVLAGQGSVQPSWRSHKGRRLGPFYRLAYRAGGRACSVYLGADGGLADLVRRRLEELQAPGRRRRAAARLRAAAAAALRRHKEELAAHLGALGLRLKGNEVRGWRAPRGRAPGRNAEGGSDA